MIEFTFTYSSFVLPKYGLSALKKKKKKFFLIYLSYLEEEKMEQIAPETKTAC